MKNPLNGGRKKPRMKNLPYYLNHPQNILPEGLTTTILMNSNSLDFHSSLNEYDPAPVRDLRELAKNLQVKNIYIKDESSRFGLNAFKGLGASYAIHKILEKDPSIETFCTATDGNHGRAVAWSAAKFGRSSRVFVPVDTTPARIEAIKKEGAIVEKINGNYEETCAVAEQKSRENGWLLVQDTATEDYEEIPAHIKAGYLTQFKELETSLHSLPEPKIDLVFLQSGVGSWPAAAAWYYQQRYADNRPKIVIVEPTEAAGMLASLKKGARTSPNGTYKTMMAGLNCGIPSTAAWAILKYTADAAVAVEDSYMEEAIRRLYYPAGEDPRVISGESGAGGMAGLLAVLQDKRFNAVKTALQIDENTRILLYNTEGATDPQNFRKIIAARKKDH